MLTNLKHIILGTAGHIDHGKTSLIRALTGIDTDRLPEEKSRGITIELGFAYLEIHDRYLFGIVDVPGHEKFIHHMVAGIGGIDLVMMIIAADEGVMPQTREHLEICSLLGVKNGLIVITKSDLVDPEWLEMVTEDVAKFTLGSFLEGKPILTLSSVTGEGIPELKEKLASLAETIEMKTRQSLFRMPIDRVFTMKGFGTVVTGTVLGGSIDVSSQVSLIPSGPQAKIRGIQIHNMKSDSAMAGFRAAINLQNIEKESVRRGMVLIEPETMLPTKLLDVNARFLPTIPKPVKNKSIVRFHSGTAETIGEIRLLDRNETQAGSTCFAQIVLEDEVAVLPGDRFLIRSYSPVRTIGGGVILDNRTSKAKRFNRSVNDYMEDLASSDPKTRLKAKILHSGVVGLTHREIELFLPHEITRINEYLDDLKFTNEIVYLKTGTSRFTGTNAWNSFKNDIVDYITGFHKSNPVRSGISKEQIRSSRFDTMDPDVFGSAVSELLAEQKLSESANMLRVPEFQIVLTKEQESIKERILRAVTDSAASGVDEAELRALFTTNEAVFSSIYQYLIEIKLIYRLPGALIFTPEILDQIKDKIVQLIRTEGSLTVGRFRDAAGISRKQAVPLLEYFDSVGLTRRVQDCRVLKS